MRRLPKVSEVIHRCGYAYYFWNDDWNKRIGPYFSYEEAAQALEDYIDQWSPERYRASTHTWDDDAT